MKQHGGSQTVKRNAGSAAALLVALLTAASASAATWNVDADGNWTDPNNWDTASYPDGATAVADFDIDVTADRTVTLDDDITLNRLYFVPDGDGVFTLDRSGAETLTMDGDSPLVEVRVNGNYQGPGPVIDVPVIVGGTGSGAATFGAHDDGAGDRIPLTFAQSVTLNRDLEFDISNYARQIKIEGNLTGTGDVTVGGTNGSVNLDGADNDFNGDLTILKRSVTARSLPDNLNLTVAAGTTLSMTSAHTAHFVFDSIAGSGGISVGWNTDDSSITLHVASGTQQIDASYQGTGFHKTGSGTAWLNNTWDTHTSATVEAGTLVINASDIMCESDDDLTVYTGATLGIGDGVTYAPDKAVTFNAGSTLTGSGTYDRPDGDWTAPADFTVAPGMSTGELRVDIGTGNTLVLNGTSELAIELDGAGNDLLTVVGDLDLGGAALNLSGSPDDGVWYTVVTADSITGSPGSVTSGYDVNVTGTEVQVMIPEPATLAMLAIGGVGLLVRHRRSA
ncbi:MAG: PEP-CTERM sorting domain-containing protein [Planctomycetota bacterium]